MSLVVDPDMLKKAKGYALRLFKLRPRSEKELREKLDGKGYPPDVAAQVIEDCHRGGYLDDTAFARAWAQGRLKRYGWRRVERELRLKGIAEEVLASLRDGVREDYDEESIALAIAQRRMLVYRDVEPLKRRKRVMDYLARRGFSPGTISKVLKQL